MVDIINTLFDALAVAVEEHIFKSRNKSFKEKRDFKLLLPFPSLDQAKFAQMLVVTLKSYRLTA